MYINDAMFKVTSIILKLQYEFIEIRIHKYIHSNYKVGYLTLKQGFILIVGTLYLSFSKKVYCSNNS